MRFHPTNPHSLIVASWDRHLYHYDTSASSDSQLLQRYEHRAPILDVAWGPPDSQIVYSVGLDHDVRATNLTDSSQSALSTHNKPSSKIAYHAETQSLISASWDSTLHIHHPTEQTYAVLQLPAKPFAISLSTTKLIVAMSTRIVHIYDITALSTLAAQADPSTPITPEPLQRRESALKFMTRSVAAMPNDLGFACSSIEGRVAVEWFDPSPEAQSKKYAFKCHRVGEKQPNPETGVEESIDVVYPVHSLTFHPTHGTFLSGGGDGIVALWDAVAKRRIRQYPRYNASVGCMDFSRDGKFLAIGVSPGFEDGGGSADGGLAEGPIQVWVRNLSDNEAKGKTMK